MLFSGFAFRDNSCNTSSVVMSHTRGQIESIVEVASSSLSLKSNVYLFPTIYIHIHIGTRYFFY